MFASFLCFFLPSISPLEVHPPKSPRKNYPLNPPLQVHSPVFPHEVYPPSAVAPSPLGRGDKGLIGILASPAQWEVAESRRGCLPCAREGGCKPEGSEGPQGQLCHLFISINNSSLIFATPVEADSFMTLKFSHPGTLTSAGSMRYDFVPPLKS